MNRDEIILLYDYHSWATRRVLDAAERCTVEQLSAPGNAPHGALLVTLIHALAAEMTWLARLRTGRTPPTPPSLEKIASVADLSLEWEAQETAMRAYLATLTDARLQERIRYTVSRGAWRDEILWHALTYIILHGVQHRSEAAMLLTGYGQSPGNLDFIIYVWEKGGQQS